jgi:uncharacterized membrane protein
MGYRHNKPLMLIQCLGGSWHKIDSPYMQDRGAPLHYRPRNRSHMMRRFQVGMRYLFALSFMGAGVNHFLAQELYTRMMPPYLPWHLFLVSLSGLVEIALGGLLLVPRVKHLAAWGLIALLIAVFPANIHMAVHPDLFPEIDATLLWARFPVQALLIAWAYAYTRDDAYRIHLPELLWSVWRRAPSHTA